MTQSRRMDSLPVDFRCHILASSQRLDGDGGTRAGLASAGFASSACSARAAIPLGIRGSRVEGPHTRGISLGGVPREQRVLKGHLPRIIYHQVY